MPNDDAEQLGIALGWKLDPYINRDSSTTGKYYFDVPGNVVRNTLQSIDISRLLSWHDSHQRMASVAARAEAGEKLRAELPLCRFQLVSDPEDEYDYMKDCVDDAIKAYDDVVEGAADE